MRLLGVTLRVLGARKIRYGDVQNDPYENRSIQLQGTISIKLPSLAACVAYARLCRYDDCVWAAMRLRLPRNAPLQFLPHATYASTIQFNEP
jgi:hypothetical protein